MTSHDERAKDILDVLLDDLGTLEREFEVPSLRAQRADLRFAPSPEHTSTRRSLGILGLMTEVAALFEPFSWAPSIDEVQGCLRKLLNAQHAGALNPSRVVERMWLLCAGRPDAALAHFDTMPMAGWPSGFYALRGLPLVIVVLAELPRTDDTVALRLMGAITTRKGAYADLRARLATVPRGAKLFEVVVRDTVLAQAAGSAEEATMVDTSEARAFIERVRNEGRSEGLAKGLERGLEAGLERGLAEGLRPLVRLFERRLGRAVTDAERGALASRLDVVGPERLGDVVLDLDSAALAAWLASPTAT
jgi:hypothetical protein